MYGALLRVSGPEVEELSEVSNFTMEDINNQKIRYITTLLLLDRVFKNCIKIFKQLTSSPSKDYIAPFLNRDAAILPGLSCSSFI